MILYVNGQDINELILGLLGEEVHLETFSVGPEKYLATLDAFLQTQNIELDKLEGVAVVVGPGSATALRSSLSIVNTLHFAKQLPLYTIEKDPTVSDEDIVTKDMLSKLKPLNKTSFAEPIYAHAPRITPSKKDALGRRKS